MGGTTTYVDVALYEVLSELAEEDNVGAAWAEQLQLPALGAFWRMLGALPQLCEYETSARRLPRYERPGYVYIQ